MPGAQAFVACVDGVLPSKFYLETATNGISHEIPGTEGIVPTEDRHGLEPVMEIQFGGMQWLSI